MAAIPTLDSSHRLLLVKLGPWTDHDDQELPRPGYGHKPGMTGEELYASARAWWVLDQRRAEKCEFLVAVHKGVTVGAWRIDHAGWRSWDMPTVGATRIRWSMKGTAVTDEEADQLVGRLVPAVRPDGRAVFGSGAAVAYWPNAPR